MRGERSWCGSCGGGDVSGRKPTLPTIVGAPPPGLSLLTSLRRYFCTLRKRELGLRSLSLKGMLCNESISRSHLRCALTVKECLGTNDHTQERKGESLPVNNPSAQRRLSKSSLHHQDSLGRNVQQTLIVAMLEIFAVRERKINLSVITVLFYVPPIRIPRGNQNTL